MSLCCCTASWHHCINVSLGHHMRFSPPPLLHHRVTALPRHHMSFFPPLLPCHRITTSLCEIFPTTFTMSPHYCITASPCHHHCITASPHEIFPTTFTMSPHYYITALLCHHAPCEIFPTTFTTSPHHCMRFSPAPLPHHRITTWDFPQHLYHVTVWDFPNHHLLHHHVTTLPHHRVTVSPCEIFPTTLVWIWLVNTTQHSSDWLIGPTTANQITGIEKPNYHKTLIFPPPSL